MVIDGTIGQQAFNQAKIFHENAKISGIIITKLDGTAKGGGAIAASSATGAKVLFIVLVKELTTWNNFPQLALSAGYLAWGT